MFFRGILLCGLFSSIGCAPVLTALGDDYRSLRDNRYTPSLPTGQTATQRLAESQPDQKPISPPPLELAALDSPAAKPRQPAQILEPPVTPNPARVTPLPLKAAPAPTQDTEIILTKAKPEDPSDKLATLTDDPGEPVTLIAARVGDSIITVRELKKAIRERMQGGPGWEQMPRAEKNQRGREVLEYLIDRQILIQSARDELKKPKQWDMLKEMIGKGWTDKELPAMIRRTKSTDEFDLRKKMADHGESLDEIKESFLLEEMARAYLGEKVRTKIVQPDLPEIYRYYRENQQRFQRAAQITWREIFIATGDDVTKDAARTKAEDARRRLLAGEDFTSVSKAMSQSPRAQDGGLWQTTPGGFGSDSVNTVLNVLPVGQISNLVSDPKGFYIIKIENRRPAGPAPFEEVQTQINEALMGAQFEKAMKVFVDKVQSRVVVTSPLFDGTPWAPKQSQGNQVASVRKPK